VIGPTANVTAADRARGAATRGATNVTSGKTPLLIARGVTATNPFRHWLLTLNTAIVVFIAGALAAPILAALGFRSAANALYAAYQVTCHQWAFRTFFLFGPRPIAVYDQQQLSDLGTDPYTFTGSSDLGWKMAICERDFAIYLAVLAVGILYALRGRKLYLMSFTQYGVLILPMALDGFTQLFGWRESTWELRLATGLLFGLASAWLVLPRLDTSFGLNAATTRYAPDAACKPTPAPDPLRHG
jgi:uncharacterized membrane protein